MDLTFNESMYGLDEMDTATESFDNYDFAMESEDGDDSAKKESLFRKVMSWFESVWKKIQERVSKIKNRIAQSKIGVLVRRFKVAWDEAKQFKDEPEKLRDAVERSKTIDQEISDEVAKAVKETTEKKDAEKAEAVADAKAKAYHAGKVQGKMQANASANVSANKAHAKEIENLKSEAARNERIAEKRGELNAHKAMNGVSEKAKAKTDDQIVGDKAADQRKADAQNHEAILETRKKKLPGKTQQAQLSNAHAAASQAKKAQNNFRNAVNGIRSSVSQNSYIDEDASVEDIAVEAAFAEYFGINHIGVSPEVSKALDAMEATTEISCMFVNTCADTIVGLESQIEQFNRDVNALRIASENYLVDGDLKTRIAASKLPANRLHQACVDLGIASESFGEKDIQNLHDFLIGANDILIDRANELVQRGAVEGYTADDEGAEIATESDLYDMDDLDAMESALDFELEMSDLDETEDDETGAATESVNFLNSLVNESYLDYEDENVAEEGLKEVAGKVARAGKSVLNAILNAIDKLVEKFRNLRAKILANKALKSPMIPDIVLRDYKQLMGVLENVQNLDDLGDNSLYKGFMGETDYAGGNYKSVKGDIKIVLGGIQKATSVLSGLQAQIRKEQNAENVDEKFVEECQTALKRYKYAYRINVRYLEFAARKTWVSK